MDIGLIGYGYWGSIWARVVLEHDEANLAWIYDQNEDAQIDAAQDHEDSEFGIYGKPAWDECDAVIIASAGGSHWELGMDAIKQRTPALVEKPLTLDAERAKKMALYGRQKNITLMVGHTHLYEDTYAKASQLINRISPVRHVDMHWTGKGQVREDIGVLWNVGPHPISLLLDIMRTPYDNALNFQVQHITDNDLSDMATVLFQYEDQRSASIHVNRWHPIKQRLAYVIGKNGDLEIDLQAKTVRLFNNGKVVEEHDGPWREPLTVELEDFIHSIQTRELPKSDALESGVPVVETIDKLT